MIIVPVSVIKIIFWLIKDFLFTE